MLLSFPYSSDQHQGDVSVGVGNIHSYGPGDLYLSLLSFFYGPPCPVICDVRWGRYDLRVDVDPDLNVKFA